MLEFPNNQERVRYAAPARAVVLAHVRITSVNPCLSALTLISSDVCVEFSFLCLAQTLKDVSGVE